MSRTVNKVTILGYVGQDPDVKTTKGGSIVANFSVATNERQKDADGEWQDRTEWHNFIAFKRTAEIVCDYVTKGTKVYIEGKLQTRSWDDQKSGVKRYKTEIIANEIVLLSEKDESEKKQTTSAKSKSADQYDDSEVPF